MRCALRAAAVAFTLSGAFVLSAPVQAAVRICQAPVSSGLASDPVEARARAKALVAWVAKARAAGTRSPSWRIAAQKQLHCVKVATGNYDCVAFAQPCTISQTPRPSPSPSPLPHRGKAKDKPIAT